MAARLMQNGRWWRRLKSALTGLAAGSAMMWIAGGAALADIRSLNIYHMHTGEHEVIVFKRDGVYDQEGLSELNHILRDWRRNETIKMDPALFDLIWEVYREAGATQPIQIVCGYRAPETNNMLRERTRGVAKFSQHTLGKAMDFFLPGVPLEKLREIGMKQQVGGVGFYPTSGSPFVHMDTGGVRAWPRMSHDQLVRLFPDGKTLHLPSDGGPLPGYNQALAEYQQHHSVQSSMVASNQSAPKGNLLAQLFGIKSGEEDEGDAAQATQPAPTSRAAQAPQVATASQHNAAPLPAPQPPRLAFAANQPHPGQSPIDEDVGPLREQQKPADKPVVMASLPLPPIRPSYTPAQPLAATPVSLTQPGSLVPLQGTPAPQRAAGAILPGGWTTGPSGVAQAPTAQTQVSQAPADARGIAALKSIDAPLPSPKPQGVIGAVPRPRPTTVTASLGNRTIDDAFSALTGAPRDNLSNQLLGYAPVAPAPETTSTSVTRDGSARLKLASLGASDVSTSQPPPLQVFSGKQARAAQPDTLPKGDRADPLSHLVSHIGETTDKRLFSAERTSWSTAIAAFVQLDPDQVPQLIAKPTEVVIASFTGSAMDPAAATDHFAGSAVVAVAVIATN
jgi:uncharacterized protein YcbK (DUF882 family)